MMKFSTLVVLSALSSTAVAFAPQSTSQSTTTSHSQLHLSQQNDRVFEQTTNSMPAPPMPVAPADASPQQFMEPVELTGEALLPAVPPSPEDIYQARSETVATSGAALGESPRWGTLEVQKAQQMTGIVGAVVAEEPAPIVTSIEPVATPMPAVDDAQDRLQARLAMVQAQASQFAAPVGSTAPLGDAVNQFTAPKIQKAQATVAKGKTYKPVPTAIGTIVGTEVNPPYQPKPLSVSWNKAQRGTAGADDVRGGNIWLRAKYAKVLEKYNAQGVAYESGETYKPVTTGAPTIVGTEVYPPAQPKPLSVAWDKGYKGN